VIQVTKVLTAPSVNVHPKPILWVDLETRKAVFAQAVELATLQLEVAPASVVTTANVAKVKPFFFRFLTDRRTSDGRVLY
jgi:hypothetical protein